MTQVEKYHPIYCVHCQKNLVPDLLEQKFQFIFEEHNITTLINKWDDLNLLATLLDLIGCILPKKESIRASPNGRKFLEWPTEHVNSTHPYTDHDFIKSKNFPQKYKKANASLNLEEVIPVKKVVAVGTKRSNSFKGTQLSSYQNTPERLNMFILPVIVVQISYQ